MKAEFSVVYRWQPVAQNWQAKLYCSIPASLRIGELGELPSELQSKNRVMGIPLSHDWGDYVEENKTRQWHNYIYNDSLEELKTVVDKRVNDTMVCLRTVQNCNHAKMAQEHSDYWLFDL